MQPLFPWDVLKSVIGGTSALDLPRLQVENHDQADAFVACYGFDWGDPNQRQEALGILAQSWDFMTSELLPPGLTAPAGVIQEMDLRNLVWWASSPEFDQRQMWACALLRVFHAVAHANYPLQEQYGHQIRAQILQRFSPHLHRRQAGLWLGRGHDAVFLTGFETKDQKPVTSTVLKLLHKVENVATDIFDHVGVRFVTRDRLDALRVVRYLRAHNVFMLANVKPTRSRNGLVDVDALAEALGERSFNGEEEREAWVRRSIGDFTIDGGPTHGQNPFSSTAYQSIQFTCRQMIRVTDPGGRHLRFFFPFEIQVLDQESYEEARSGRASHEVYKQRQRQAVQRRVLGNLLPT